MQDFNETVEVGGYSDSLGTATFRVVTGVIAYDNYENTTYYLRIHQAIEVLDTKVNLLCPNQLRDFGIRVNDEPKHLVSDPTPYHHAITITDTDDNSELIIPLDIRGVTPTFPTRKPTREEFRAERLKKSLT